MKDVIRRIAFLVLDFDFCFSSCCRSSGVQVQVAAAVAGRRSCSPEVLVVREELPQEVEGEREGRAGL